MIISSESAYEEIRNRTEGSFWDDDRFDVCMPTMVNYNKENKQSSLSVVATKNNTLKQGFIPGAENWGKESRQRD